MIFQTMTAKYVVGTLYESLLNYYLMFSEQQAASKTEPYILGID